MPGAFGIVEGASAAAVAREWAVLAPIKGAATGRTDPWRAFAVALVPAAAEGLGAEESCECPWCECLLSSFP